MAISNLPLKNPWLALRAATEKAARSGDRFQKMSDVERLFNFARTYFTTGEPSEQPQWTPQIILRHLVH